jgi:4-hydroxybenzoate polyprenyltransferase
MLRRLTHILEMVRFSHTLFALPFALLAAAMAWLTPPRPEFRWQDLLGILLAMVFARSTAMAFNRLADRKLDALNPRTGSRHLPAGILSAESVAAFAVTCSAAFVASTLLFLPNRWPVYLSVPVLAFLCGYSYAKRFTSWAHVWLGMALSLAPVCAWLALRSELAWPPVVLSAAVMLWVAGFDMIYACQDQEFDVQAGLHSVPARFGTLGGLRLAAACHLGTVLVLLLLPWTMDGFGWIYWGGVAAVAALLAYEHSLVRPDDLVRVNLAFFHVNAVISVGLFVVGTVDLLV